ncbi:13595_t:CDS:1 [Funneliformis geosporum]|uniref:16615_t:CDS:1 n=1 Tax=Funneliformis geosporum TaxID=1117311 RepID=A0A9W4WQY7_9GLOM|nr:13595_t:CDS:1 [Funneliformis geosporum]CAI2172362.1 16615_t:CDS:1 [Funneliformis geosporum]
MYSKSLFIIINIFLILLFQSTFNHSFPLTEQEVVPLTEQEVALLTEQEVDSLNSQDIPLFEQDIGSFYCEDGSSLECCPLLSRNFASRHHSRVATIVLINNSGYEMELVAVSLESGRWITSNDNNYNISCEPQIYPLANGQGEAFSSVTSHFLGGVKGYAIFSMNDDILSNFIISWSVPTIGSPKYKISGISLSENYDIVLERDLGNTVYRVIVESPTSFWTLFTIIPPFVILPCCCCACFSNDPSERRKLLPSVPNLDALPEYRDTVPNLDDPYFDAPPAYSSIPNRGPGNKYSNNNTSC